AVLRLDLVGNRMDRVGERIALLQPTHLEVPHEEVHRLALPERLDPLLVKGRMPGFEDVGMAVVALDQQAALVIGGEVHGADQAIPPALAHPALSSLEKRLEDRRVVLGLDEAELPVAAALVLVPAAIDLGCDPPDRLAISPSEEELGLGMLEVGVLLLVQELLALIDQGRDPGSALMEPKRQLDELLQLTPALHGSNLNRASHGRA